MMVSSDGLDDEACVYIVRRHRRQAEREKGGAK